MKLPLRLARVVLGLALVVGATYWTRARAGGDGAPLRHPTTQESAPRPDALDWGVLQAYEYKPGLLDLPAGVTSLDGKRVTMQGFMEPLYEFDDIHEFILRPLMVLGSLGITPHALSAGVQVTLPKAAKGLSLVSARLRVEGTLRVLETKEQGYIVSIYRLDDARAIPER